MHSYMVKRQHFWEDRVENEDAEDTTYDRGIYPPKSGQVVVIHRRMTGHSWGGASKGVKTSKGPDGGISTRR